jgi:DNA (cytosine-5)-methyltransferase 1
VILEKLLSRLKRVARTALPAPLLIADLFCGAGGFDEGARQALVRAGLSYKLVAVNHWGRAIETHKLNHPEANAYQVDVYETEPLEAVPEGELDVLMASPTCIYYSHARGAAPVSWDQRWGRMSPTQVKRWVRDLKPRVLIVENVREFRDWGPICKRRTRCKKHDWAGPSPKEPGRDICGKPRKNKAGIYFKRWWRELERLGYRLDERILNAADFGDSTTRKRLFIVGVRLDAGAEHLARICWPAPTHAEHPELGDLFSPRLLPWEGAWKCINWELEGKSIFNLEDPHAEKTLARVFRGTVRYRWGDRFVLKQALFARALGRKVPDVSRERRHAASSRLVFRTAMGQSNALCVYPDSSPLPTVTTDGGLAALEPFTFPLNQGRERARGDLPVSKPLGTIVTREMRAVVEPFALAQHFGAEARSLGRPLPSPVAINRTAILEPFVLSQASGGAPRSVADPVPAIPTEGAHALISPYYGTSECRSVEEPLGTATTRDRFAFVTAAFGEREGQAARVQSLDRPLPTLCAEGRVPLVQGVEFEERPLAEQDLESALAAIAKLSRKRARELLADFADVDIRLRMLKAAELARSMGFWRYVFAGTETEQTRQVGNAVAVGVARELFSSVVLGLSWSEQGKRGAA